MFKFLTEGLDEYHIGYIHCLMICALLSLFGTLTPFVFFAAVVLCWVYRKLMYYYGN